MIGSGERTLRVPGLANPWLGFQAVAIAAAVVLALTTVLSISVIAAVLAALLLIGSRALDSWQDQWRRTMAIGSAAVGAFLIIGVLAVIDRPYEAATTLLIALPVVGLGVAAWRAAIEDRGVRWIATLALAAIVVFVGVLWIEAATAPDVDVLTLHESAADAVRAGQNPYTHATAFDSSAGSDGAVIEGYVYPGVTLVAYAGSDLLFGDPRWASVLAIVALVFLTVRPWRQMEKREAGAVVVLGLVLVTYPWLGTVFWFGWTDPIALPLLLAGALLWRRNPMLSAVLLGLAFGARQYLVLALPLMLFWDAEFRWKRAGIATGVAAIVQLPFLMMNPTAYWDQTVMRFLELPIRTDSMGLARFGLDLPFWVVLAVVIGLAFWMARGRGGPSRFLIGLSGVLAVAFLIGSQAFMNYWFFVAALAVSGVAVAVSPAAVEVEPSGGTP